MAFLFTPITERTTVSTREQKHWQHLETNKITRQIRKHRDAPPDAGPARQRDWTEEYLQDPERFDEMDLPAHERVMARGEVERRKGNWTRALHELEREYKLSGELGPTAPPLAAAPQAPAGRDGLVQGTVTRIGPGSCRVEIGSGVVACGFRASLYEANQGYTNVVAAGDQVLVTLSDGDGDRTGGVVEQVLPRRSALVRPDVFHPHLQQVIAANVDRLLIILSWRDPAWWPELVDRYLIAAERNRLEPIICLNKVDLACDASEPRTALAPYERLGRRVLFTSARSGEGLAELAELLRGKVTALAGLSGVGKTSLLKAIDPDLELRVGEVSARRHEGRHTTTQVALHRLKAGGCVMDTPGIREFGLSNLRRHDLAAFYPEFRSAAEPCRFADCSHLAEPGCAVRRAVRDGRIAAVRYDNYRKIRRSLPT
jgi:ribosome biogenesis GTPase